MKRVVIQFALILALVPVFAAAQSTYTFTREGVFGCNAGQYGGSPGTTAAIGGVYVPVNDAAVTLNTGILVYKECILRGIANRTKENATADIVKAGTLGFLNGRTVVDDNGQSIQLPLFPQNLRIEKLREENRSVALSITNGTFDSINPAFSDAVKRAVVRGYYLATQKPTQQLTCDYADVQNALQGNPQSVWDALNAFTNPACSPLPAYDLANQFVLGKANSALSDMMTKLSWGNGIFDRAHVDQNGDLIVDTPGILVGQGEEQLLSSGFRQQENATDIDEMVGALFSGMTSQVIQGSNGLAGLVQTTSGQPSYLDQMVQEAAQGLRDAANNAALVLLQSMQKVEKAYGDIMRAIRDSLASTKSKFRTDEAACWSGLIQKVCATSLRSDNTCTSIALGQCTKDQDGNDVCPQGVPLKIATSTIYSDAAIATGADFGSQTTVEQNIANSDKAMQLFAQLIANVSGTASKDAQALALQQVDQLVRQHLLHTQSDLETATAAQKSVQQNLSTLTDAIAHAWNGDASDGTAGVIPWDGVYPPKSGNDIVGWCNYKTTGAASVSTIKNWITVWTKK